MTASATLSQPVDLVVCPDTPEALTTSPPSPTRAGAPVSPTEKFATAPAPATATTPDAETLRAELAAVLVELTELHHDDEIATRMTAVAEWREEIGHAIRHLGRRKRALRTQLGLDPQPRSTATRP